MRSLTIVLAALLGVTTCALGADPASTSQPIATLQTLRNEPSRAALFELIEPPVQPESSAAQHRANTYFNLYGPFRFPYDAKHDVIEQKPRVNSIFGIDLNHYTPANFPMKALDKKQIKFVFLKATQGTDFKDGKFTWFWKKLGALPQDDRVHRGAYHFLTASGDGAAQAATFLNFLSLNGGLKPTDMPPVLDLEWDKANMKSPDRWARKTASEIIASAKAWLGKVEQKTGRTPVLYTNDSWWRERIGAEGKFVEFAHYPIWIADYSNSSRAIETPRVPDSQAWTLWQYTDAATMESGFEGEFDASIFKGTDEQFYKKLGVKSF